MAAGAAGSHTEREQRTYGGTSPARSGVPPRPAPHQRDPCNAALPPTYQGDRVANGSLSFNQRIKLSFVSELNLVSVYWQE